MLQFWLDRFAARKTRAAAAAIVFAVGASAALALVHPVHQKASASSLTALQLADRALYSSQSLDDEGRWRLIDPIGPGGVSSLFAKTEVFAPTMIYGQYGGYDPVRDPFAPQEQQNSYPPMPYGPPRGAVR